MKKHSQLNGNELLDEVKVIGTIQYIALIKCLIFNFFLGSFGKSLFI